MKKTLLCFAALVAASLAVQAADCKCELDKPALDTINNWYVSTFGGVSAWQTNINVPVFADDSKKTGFNLGMKLGYDFAPEDWLRPVVELEMQYNQYNRTSNTWQDLNPPLVRTKGKMKTQTFSTMVNMLGKFNLGNWQPYAGAGLGWYTLHSDLDIKITGIVPPVSIKSGQNDNGFAWQLIGGIDYTLKGNWGLFTEYKWTFFHTNSREVVKKSDNTEQQFVSLVGIRYKF